MRNGKVIWRTRPRGGKMASSPAIVGDDLVVHGMDGIVRVLDRRNGKLRWHFRVGSPIESSPIVHGGLDYFGAWNGRVYALDLKKRKLRWSYRSGYKITSSAAIAGKTLYIGDYGGRLLALSTRTGKLRFSRSVNGRIYGTPAVAAGRVFVPSSTGNSLTAFTTSGRYLWRVRTGGYVYSSPAVWAGRVFFGSYNGRFYSVSAKSGRVLWSVGAGGPVSGAAVVVAGVAYAGSTWGRITGVDAKSGRVVLRFPHGEYVPVSGNGRRLLLHGYSRVWAVEPGKSVMKRWLIGGAIVLVLLVGGVVGRLRRLQARGGQGRARLLDGGVRHDRGGGAARRRRRRSRRRLEVVWPLNGYDAERNRVGPFDLRPPFRRVWTFRARQLLEFPPAIAYGRLYFTNNSGVMFAVNAKTGKRAWKLPIGRCVAASPAVADGTVYQSFLNRPPCNSEATPGRLEGEVIAFSAGFGKIRWRTRLGPTESSPLVADGRVYVGDWRGRVYALDEATGRVRWTFQGKGRIKGARREVRQPALRRHLRRLPLRAARDDREGDLADEVAGPARRPRPVLLDAGGRLRARLHRLDRRQGLLLRRGEREAPLVAGHGRLRLRLARGLAARRCTPAPTAAASMRSTPPPATSAGASGRTGTSPARRPC